MRWYLMGSNWNSSSKAWSIVSLSTRNPKWTARGSNCSLWSQTWLSCSMTRFTLHYFPLCSMLQCLLCCANIVCVSVCLLCDFVHVCANTYVAICTTTCKAHPMLWHCLFSTRYSEHQMLYHINCKHLLYWSSSVMKSFLVAILHLGQSWPPF